MFVLGILLALIPATGSGAPQGPWQLPASDLSATGQDARGVDIAVAPDGTSTAVWRRFDGLKDIVQASTRPPGGLFGEPVDLSATGQDASDPKIAVAPDGTATVVWSRSNGANTIVQVATRPPGGSFGPPIDLSEPGGDALSAEIAAASDGTVGVVWRRKFPSNFIVQAAIRPPGGEFSNPDSLSGGGSQSGTGAQIAFAPDGTATVIWSKSNGSNEIVQATTRPSGGSFLTPVNLSEPGQSALEPQIGTAPDGTATVVWYRFDGGNNIVQAATRPPGSSFGPPVDISELGENSDAPQIAIGPDGEATVIWEFSCCPDQIIHASIRPSGGQFGPPLDLSGNGGEDNSAKIAYSPDGTVTVVWSRNPTGLPSFVQAATRPPGATFGEPVDLSASGQDAGLPQIAAGPDGQATAVWQRSNSSVTIIQQASTTPPSFTLDVTRTGTGTGTVTSSPAGIDCGADCSEDYLSYTKVTLTAAPDPGSSFGGWSGACLGAAGMSCELEMTEDLGSSAGFEANPPPTDCKKATLKLKNVKKNKKNGTAKLTAKVGEAGKLVVKGSKKNKKTIRKAKKVGKYKLQIKAKGRAAKKLKKKGRYKLKPKVVFKPSSDCSNRTKSKKVKLVRR